MDAFKQCLNELRPHMISLVETRVGKEDLNYMSSIGNQYGDIYENQLEVAMNSRLNQTEVPEYFETLIKPIY